MDITKVTHYVKSFWIWNLVGWLAYFLITYFNFYWFQEVFKYDILRLLIITVFGLFTTSILRYCYLLINVQRRSIILLTLIIVSFSFLAGNIWFWSSRTVYYSIFGRGISWFMNLTLSAYQYSIFWNTILLLGWSSLYFSIKFWIEWNNQRLATELAREQTQKANLQILRYQLNPHFLFNTLNSIRALITEDKREAKTLVTELSEFLRYSLVSTNFPEVSLREEIDAVKHFMYIEKRRYEDKLQVEFTIDSMADEYPIISFIIQPLVENAVRYGMQSSTLPLQVNISAQVKHGNLLVSVTNSGHWIDRNTEAEPAETKPGSGLDNVRQRLGMAYPDKHKFVIDKMADYVQVSVEIHKDIKAESEEAS